MRIASFEIHNYKGIALAELGGLSTESVVTISGRNGTGKSLVLEALVGAWSGRYDMTQRVGPWADQLRVNIVLSLTEEEWEAVDAWHERFHGGGKATRASEVALEFEASRAGGARQTLNGIVLQILRNGAFQREHPFAIIDFLPANRLVPSQPSPTVDLAMLNIERVEQERVNMLDQFINSRAPMSLPSVANYLVTLDYQAFLAARQELAVSNEYERLATAFLASTGKVLRLPEYDPARGSHLEVELPTGHRHGLADLSSGEQEMLAMMYFVRRLSAAGGVLCVDEPEQHLHPTLQAALFGSMQDLADRAQVIVVSHSVNLISASPVSGLVQLSSPVDGATNQIKRLKDVPGKAELVAELGVTPADLFQSDMLLVVEGDTDEQWLRALFPLELGRAHVMVAGSSNQVRSAHETLAKFPAGIPWLCIRDRDLLTDDDVQDLQSKYPSMHFWPRRAIESLFLDAPLIASAMKTIGRTVPESEIEGWLKAIIDPLKSDVLEVLVDADLRRQYPPPDVEQGIGRFAKLERQLRDYSKVNEDRANAVAATVEAERVKLDARWSSDGLMLVDPKPVLEQLNGRLGAFKSTADLMNALVARARDDLSVRPAGLEALRLKVAQLLTT